MGHEANAFGDQEVEVCTAGAAWIGDQRLHPLSDASRALDLALSRRSDWGPVRLRTNGRRHRATGLYFSIKSGRHLPYESRLELHDLWRAEVDTAVVECRPQPFTLSFMLDDRLQRYTPNRLDVLANGRQRVVEVKEGPELDLRDAERVGAVEGLLAARVMSFELHMRREIQAEPSFSAVEAVQRGRRTHIGERERAAAERRLSDGPMALQQMVADLGAGALGFARVSALMVRRVLEIDLGAGLGADARVWAVEPC